MTESAIPAIAEQEAQSAETLAVSYSSYAIATQEAYGSAANDLLAIKQKGKALEELRKSLTAPLDESKKRIMDFFRKPQDALATAESTIKRAMLTWQQEEERKRQAREAELREQQRKEEERLRKQAEKAAAKGKDEKAEELIQKAAEVANTVVVVPPTAQPVAGIQTRKIWKFEVVDKSKVPADYLIVDESKLGAMVRATKGTVQVPGVRIYSEDSIAAGR